MASRYRGFGQRPVLTMHKHNSAHFPVTNEKTFPTPRKLPSKGPPGISGKVAFAILDAAACAVFVNDAPLVCAACNVSPRDSDSVSDSDSATFEAAEAIAEVVVGSSTEGVPMYPKDAILAKKRGIDAITLSGAAPVAEAAVTIPAVVAEAKEEDVAIEKRKRRAQVELMRRVVKHALRGSR
jgi:hypothetical protein